MSTNEPSVTRFTGFNPFIINIPAAIFCTIINESSNSFKKEVRGRGHAYFHTFLIVVSFIILYLIPCGRIWRANG